MSTATDATGRSDRVLAGRPIVMRLLLSSNQLGHLEERTVHLGRTVHLADQREQLPGDVTLEAAHDLELTPLAEIPQGCSSKFPTLLRLDSRQVLLSM
jgi:hypothetical protein